MNADNITPDLNGKVILLTGGTGSFGKKFCEIVLARYSPKKLIIYSRDEDKQYSMAQMPQFRDQSCLRYLIGDVRDLNRLEMALRNVDYVVHAAALKHVTVAEYNPFECIRTNVHGAENVVTSSIRAGVKRVVALSTDKAANPINLYGASKLASDKIFVAAKRMVGADINPTFSVVRYGNVVGSRGSVVPFFQKLVQEGSAELPVTDERMTRFWITLEKGVEFVLTSLAMMRGGEIFVPKIPSATILELAKAIGPDLKTKIIGIRPGEKLHEVMITEDDARTTLELPDRYIIRPMIYDEETHYHVDEKPVDDGFMYSSDKNDDWLDAAAISKMLEQS
jgi:UDP-N-acetylglucosamine 4,6-dehydratase/5-epimerase